MAAKIVVLYVVSATIRGFCLLNCDKLPWISSGIGITTPQNSWKRVTEGIHLHRNGVNPYSGGIFHETPLLLVVFDLITHNWNVVVPFLFVACDMLTAFVLSTTADRFASDMLVKQNQRHSTASEKLLIKASDLSKISFYVAAVYLFHPYCIASCCAKTTTVFANLVLSLVLYCTASGKPIWTAFFLALATYQSFYPALLLLPCAAHIAQQSRSEGNPTWLLPVAKMFGFYTVSLAGLLILSFQLLNSWNFLNGVYGFVLYVEDFTPNIGLFWYFFTEMFEHFRNFFICTFQMNAFIYVIPLVIRFRDDSFFVVFVLIGLMTIFKSYPSVGDISLYMSLLPIWSHLYSFMRQTFVIGCIFLACSVLGPVLYHMWIYAGSANANFFFGTTLALNTAQIFLITDLLFAYIKREYHLLHGVNLMVDGKLKKLTFQ